MSAGYVLDLARLRPDVRAAVLDLAERIAADVVAQVLGEAEAERERAFWAGADLQRRADDVARGIAEWANRPTFDVLLDRRGQHERAERVRADHRRRGIATGAAA